MKKIALLFVSIFVIACSSNPLTGKKNFILVKNSQLFPMAYQQYQQVLKDEKVISNTSESQMIKTVGNKIKTAAENYLKDLGKEDFLNGYAWEFNLINDDSQINAWCMPGGKVAFYTGILPVAQDDTGVAVVMGHEITHALAEHSAQRYSQALVAQGLQVVGGVALSGSKYQGVFNSLYPVGAQAGIMAFSRSNELEADRQGLRLMAMAGYDPREAPKFWKRMEAATAGKQTPPEFFSTHPNPGKRIAQLEKLIPEMLPLYYKAIGQNNPSTN